MISYCRRCGSPTQQRIPPMEDRERACCPACGYIDYVNPVNVVGTVPSVGAPENILLCRRAIEPRKGYWTLPAGFMELGESVEVGALRETREETGANATSRGLYALISVLPAGQVHFFFRAEITNLDVEPGPETLEQKVFGVDEIPWDELSFQTVTKTLRHYVEDVQRGSFPLHTSTIE